MLVNTVLGGSLLSLFLVGLGPGLGVVILIGVTACVPPTLRALRRAHRPRRVSRLTYRPGERPLWTQSPFSTASDALDRASKDPLRHTAATHRLVNGEHPKVDAYLLVAPGHIRIA